MPQTLGPRLATGRTAEVYAWREGQVLKLFRSWCPCDAARQEADIVRTVAAQGYPTPRALDVVDVTGRAGVVYERVDGPTLLRLSAARPWRLVGLSRRFAELHAAMHLLHGEGLPSVRPSLEGAIRSAEGLSPDERAGVLRVLESLRDEETLCHMDFHPDQVIMGRDGPVVIDWTTARRGAAAADVARTLVILAVGSVPDADPVLRVFSAVWRGLVRLLYLSRYRALRRDVTLAEIKAWIVPLAAARMREGIPGEDRRLRGIIRAGLRRSGRR